MDIQAGNRSLKNLSSINVIIGKNGCGKSSILRHLDTHRNGWTHVKYISPERGGKVSYEPNIENNMQSNPNWTDETRRRNHDESFRQKSIAQLKNLEMLVNRKRSNDARDGNALDPHFDEVLGLINNLLDNVQLVSSDKPTPEIKGITDGNIRSDDQLSSGEKELITLAIEVLYFVYQIKNGTAHEKKALLLLDEPDVHLHPDLQYKLIILLVEAVKNLPITTVISTHSTAILGALNNYEAHVSFMKKNASELTFSPINSQLKDIIPIFGAHPLSNVFNQSPILLVEGEDDERIWQQAVRTAQGKIKLWPCQAGSKDKLNEYETKASELIDAIYDSASAYSLRDKDNDPYDINDIPNVIRARLNCYAAENLLLSDEVLALLGTNWEDMKEKINAWLQQNASHPKHAEMTAFSTTFDRRSHKVKDLEVVFIYLTGKSKPWEVAVGQAIAGLNPSSGTLEGSLADFLGKKIVSTLNLLS
ncbi:MAG: AAA family ATPase [Pseudomonadota bacterium]